MGVVHQFADSTIPPYRCLPHEFIGSGNRAFLSYLVATAALYQCSFPDCYRSSRCTRRGGNSIQDVHQVRKVLWESDAIREGFIAENPAKLSDTDLNLASSWQYRVAGRFFIFRHLKKFTVFLSQENPPQAYGVLGLASPIREIVPWPVPVLVDAVLLPFEDKIIYDSLLSPYSVSFGGGIRRGLNDDYRRVQEQGGVITTLQPRLKTKYSRRSIVAIKKSWRLSVKTSLPPA